MSLKEYTRKRNFKKTVEPRGGVAAAGGGHRFVVQKHAASHLHYDFRLEIGGALKSWAVPKGLPRVKGEKRLAVRVEDHPVSYIDFEGTIPQGQYGGGTVMVWDRGTFESPGAVPAKDLEGGKLHFTLHGKKLKGDWYLVRLRDGKDWLLIKAGADLPPISKKADDTSALSGKSMKQLAAGNHVWQANRHSAKKSRPAPAVPAFVEPMKARLVNSAPPGDWIYEIKFDGFRALALKNGREARLLSRQQKDFGGKFPEVLRSVEKIAADDVILEGEIVALDAGGRSSFQLLQAGEPGSERPPIFFYAFDLLQCDGQDLRREPLERRKARLAELLQNPPGVIRYSASLEGKVADLLKEAKRLNLEGLIGKRRDSTYEAGRRSGAWIKLKLHHEQEMVIGGYSEPEGSRKNFGALLLGYHEKAGLRFSGKVGTGFTEALLKSLYCQFQTLRRTACPFVNLPEKRAGRYGAGVTAGEMKSCHWLAPKLVCQIKFSEWTRDGKLRQPVFLGLREDKDAGEVIREKAA